MTDTTGRRIRIETETNGRRERTRFFVGETEITDQIIAVDWHHDHQSIPTATVTVAAPDMAVDATEAVPEPLASELITGTNPVMCVGCYLEHRAGTRDIEHVNDATLIVGGNSTCTDHIQIGPAPAIPGRTASGIIIGEQL